MKKNVLKLVERKIRIKKQNEDEGAGGNCTNSVDGVDGYDAPLGKIQKRRALEKISEKVKRRF